MTPIETVQAMLSRLEGANEDAGRFPSEWPEIAAGRELLAQMQAAAPVVQVVEPLTDEEFLSALDSNGIACDPGAALAIKELLELRLTIKENT